VSGEFNDRPFLQALKYLYQLVKFCSKIFREKQTTLHLEYIPPRSYSGETWLFFWKLPLKPEARSLWYRKLFNKVHNNTSVFVFDSSVSPLCSLCYEEPEDSFHFFIACPYKRFIWKRALDLFAPHIEFSASHLSSLVFDLQQFHLVITQLSSSWLLTFFAPFGDFTGSIFLTMCLSSQKRYSNIYMYIINQAHL
jgi:hypothetical protein